jgi:hypothetical protein
MVDLTVLPVNKHTFQSFNPIPFKRSQVLTTAQKDFYMRIFTWMDANIINETPPERREFFTIAGRDGGGGGITYNDQYRMWLWCELVYDIVIVNPPPQIPNPPDPDVVILEPDQRLCPDLNEYLDVSSISEEIRDNIRLLRSYINKLQIPRSLKKMLRKITNCMIKYGVTLASGEINQGLVGWWNFEDAALSGMASQIDYHGVEWDFLNNPSAPYDGTGANAHLGVKSVNTIHTSEIYVLDAVSASAPFNSKAGQANLFTNWGNDPFTIAMWFKPTTDKDSALISIGNDHTGLTDASGLTINVYEAAHATKPGKVGFSLYSGTTQSEILSTSTYTASAYNLVVVKYDPSNDEVGISLNGEAFATATSAISIDLTPISTANASAILAGSLSNSTSTVDLKFEGYIDNTMLWHKYQPDGVITDLYNEGTGVTYAAVVQSYANMAAFEASGDTWEDGEQVVINGIPFTYYSSLATGDHNGLMHAFPFALDSGTQIDNGFTIEREIADGVDPDSWGWTDDSVGTKGVDYELDTDGGKARLRNITGSGQFILKSPDSTSTSDISMYVYDALEASTSGAGLDEINLYHRFYASPTTSDRSVISVHKSVYPTNWSILDGAAANVDTGIAFATPTRIWLYHDKATNRTALWTDNALVEEHDADDLGAAPEGYKDVLRSTIGNSNLLKLGYQLKVTGDKA